jgi:hypothetical protein
VTPATLFGMLARRSVVWFGFALVAAGCAHTPPLADAGLPAIVLGEFEDDHGITYAISQALWFQQPRSRFHVVRWNAREQYLIARNDNGNPGESGRWTRIDWAPLSGMAPYTWAFCLSAYDAATADLAEAARTARRDSLRIGCNGYPFSRMKRR